MNTLAFVNFLLIKIFSTLIRQNFPPSRFCAIRCRIPYSAKWWQGKTLANQLFQSFGKENVGEFKLLTFS